MKRKILKLTKKPFVRNVIIMASGTAAAQLVTMALYPFITRLYGPEAFGLMGVFMAVVGIIAPIAALTYPIAIVLPKSDRDAKGIIILSLYISTGIAVITAIILLVFHQPVVRLFNLGDIAPFLYLIPIVVVFSGFMQVAEQWLIRTKQFAITAKVAFLHSLIVQGSKVGIGFIYPLAAVLIILSALGNGLRALMMVIFARKTDYKQTDIHTKKVSIKEIATKYRDFPYYRAPEVFLDAASQGLPILLLTSFFGPASVGFYSIGRMVLRLPTQLISKSVGDVFYPRISEAANNGENLTKLIRKATIALGAVGIIPFATVIIFGPWLFSFVFGAEWVTAGEYARWIALWTFFGFINRPSVVALPVLAAQAFHLKFTVFMLITRIAALAIGYYVFMSDLVAIALFGVSGAILNISLILITLHISKNYENKQSDGDRL
ncbi:lipopolysaccharide biosynthesis protein [Virgibacillus litoralis]|uniref:O-antigen/teichoic acid export membrane protein n=1 Tax=Virgibacillus litoralis TaxID=578221 RepID=A0ABS4HHZ5_9BACI|nr:oligosaccharide flippase family protein [Virgibacillus litoralis]MBP1950546.1 O-antigen/teichoic acid export membrane protein [Virgibacillus litoralis]